MNPVALLTPTYRRDLELCTLLCESVDRHVTAFSRHYLLVPDCDEAIFAPLASERRVVLPASRFLPAWLRPLPSVIQRKRRQFWWSLRASPVSGWHVQQILKIAASASLPEQRFCILDSDVVFFRKFDLTPFEHPNAIPLLNIVNGVTPGLLRHVAWIETTHQLLGYPVPNLPASDFIGHLIFWDQETVREMISRVEAIGDCEWVEALCRVRNFSEYMLYGYFAQTVRKARARHIPVATTPCLSYWDEPTLGKDELHCLLQRADSNDVAFSIASFSGTPVKTIRAVIAENEAPLAPANFSGKDAEVALSC
ncbi:MAG: hypothetical protein HY852_19885 [Bradyrhizobium sp.]|uniref:DUF6492 family protein n=1 Tax=Bradyrhizobium sp. TaxID=376 RepID=UPI0025C10852|nr:DUF6492 family protein [Bradyrhizobium sp.]MBI5264067.1 hypothetical protein [Bradyrhizobium sp.]